MAKNEVLQSIGTIVIGLVVFGVGFYLGLRAEDGNKKESSQIEIQAEAARQQMQSSSDGDSTKQPTTPVPEVYWAAPGGQSSCPDTHPMKAKFTSTGNVFYPPTHKSYKRVTAEICLANAEYALASGFLEKKE